LMTVSFTGCWANFSRDETLWIFRAVPPVFILLFMLAGSSG
jgi:hypothetical protein